MESNWWEQHLTTKYPVVYCLLSAADILETEGWCRFVSQTPDGRRCMTGAVYEARKRMFRDFGNCEAGGPVTSGAMTLLQEAVGNNPAVWNDQQLDPRPVIAKLREVAFNYGKVS